MYTPVIDIVKGDKVARVKLPPENNIKDAIAARELYLQDNYLEHNWLYALRK